LDFFSGLRGPSGIRRGGGGRAAAPPQISELGGPAGGGGGAPWSGCPLTVVCSEIAPVLVADGSLPILLLCAAASGWLFGILPHVLLTGKTGGIPDSHRIPPSGFWGSPGSSPDPRLYGCVSGSIPICPLRDSRCGGAGLPYFRDSGEMVISVQFLFPRSPPPTALPGTQVLSALRSAGFSALFYSPLYVVVMIAKVDWVARHMLIPGARQRSQRVSEGGGLTRWLRLPTM